MRGDNAVNRVLALIVGKGIRGEQTVYRGGRLFKIDNEAAGLYIVVCGILGGEGRLKARLARPAYLLCGSLPGVSVGKGDIRELDSGGVNVLQNEGEVSTDRCLQNIHLKGRGCGVRAVNDLERYIVRARIGVCVVTRNVESRIDLSVCVLKSVVKALSLGIVN